MKRLALLTILALPFLNCNGLAQQYEHKTAGEWVPLLADEEEWGKACYALKKLGPEAQKQAMPFLLKMLEDRCAGMRCRACRCLKQFGRNAQPAVPVLLPMLADRQECGGCSLGFAACEVLCAIDLKADKVMPALLRFLDDPHPGTVRVACHVVASMGAPARDAVPLLIKTLQTKDGDLQWYAVEALGKIGPASAPALPVLIKVLRDPQLISKMDRPCFERLCIDTLEKIGPASVGALIDSWDLVAGEQGAYILGALGKIGPAAKQALPLLEKSLSDERRACRREAALAIWRIEKRKEIVPVLVDMIEYVEAGGDPAPPRQVDQTLCTVLGELGKDAVPALATLERLLSESLYEHEQKNYLAIIRAIDPDTAKRIGARKGVLP